MEINLLIHHDTRDKKNETSENTKTSVTFHETCETTCNLKRRTDCLSDQLVKRVALEVSDDELDTNSDFSAKCSRRSTVTSIDDTDIETERECHHTPIIDCNSLLLYLRRNKNEHIHIPKVMFQDLELPTLTGNFEPARSQLISDIHAKYVEPLLELTGYKWIRRDLPSRGKGMKIFCMKYRCAQQKKNKQKGVEERHSEPREGRKLQDKEECTGELNGPCCAIEFSRRNITNPLKQFDCLSMYSIKYKWSKQLVEISFTHMPHPPYRRLPDILKPFILARLDMRANELYHEILECDDFKHIQHLICFTKVQNFWSKQRNIKKEESTKSAFRKFFSS